MSNLEGEGLVNVSENNETVSPVLSEGKQNIMIDIDGTICDDVPNEEPERMKTATAFNGAADVINGWYDEGHIITFFTSRESATHRAITEKWLADNGFKYHRLLMDKPRGGNYHWIDNHMVQGSRFKTNWDDLEADINKKGKLTIS